MSKDSKAIPGATPAPTPEPSSSTAVANWKEELTKLAVATAQAEKPSSNWISFKGAQMSLNGNPFKDNKVEWIVLHSIFENQLYGERYNPNNPQPPICYAFGETDDDLRPHKDSAKPQSETCEGCRHNAWNSDPEGGKGKACKNVRRLGGISAGDATSPEKIAKAEVALAKLPVTSVRNWSTYANQVANALKLPPLAVITEMEETPDPRYTLAVNFRLVDKVNEDLLPALMKRRGEIHDLMFAPYDKPQEPNPNAAQGAPRKF